MAFIPPGITFLTRGLIALLLPCGAIATLKFILYNYYNIFIPTWALISGIAIGLPIVLTIRVQIVDMKHRRRAAVLGARVVPCVKGKWPGNIDEFRKFFTSIKEGYPAEAQCEWSENTGGTFNVRIFWENMMFTIEPENIKTILATDFNNYVKGNKFKRTVASVLGTGVFNSDGEMWKFHRSITRPFFSRDRISHFDNFDRHADDIIKQIKDRMREGFSIDFQDAISRFTLDSASEFLLGRDVKSLSAGLPFPYTHKVSTKSSQTADDFAASFAEAQFAIARRLQIGWMWPLFEMWKDKTEQPMKVVNSFLDPLLKDALQRHQSKTSEEKKAQEVADDETLLDHLVKMTSDESVLKDEILNILIAGRDTTAATLTFTIYFLARDPVILSRLRQEILTSIGRTARPTYDDIRGMKFLRAVINETLRLFPAVPFNVRETINETTWASKDPLEKPMYIPAGTSVPYSTFMMHRRTDLWGSDALEFDPDRFLDDRVKKYLTHNPYIFLPFNAGPRICLGQQFAYNEMSFVLIRLLQTFSSISLDVDAQSPDTRPPAHWAGAKGRKGTEEIWPKVHLTMYTYGGLWVKMSEAQETK